MINRNWQVALKMIKLTAKKKIAQPKQIENNQYLLIFVNLPATHAVIKHAIQPEMSARTATCKMSRFRSGATADRAPIMIPRATTLEKPHRAYVATISEWG